MEPKFVKKKAFKVIGLKYHGRNKNGEIPALWPEFMKRFDEVKPLASEPMLFYGVCMNYDIATEEFDYYAAIGVGDTAETPEGLDKIDIPENEYAVFECTLPTIMEAYENIYKKWFPDSEYKRLTDKPEFELYDDDFSPEVPESKLYLYIPIVKK